MRRKKMTRKGGPVVDVKEETRSRRRLPFKILDVLWSEQSLGEKLQRPINKWVSAMTIGLVARKKAQNETETVMFTHMSTRTRRPVADYGVVGDEEPFRDTASEDAAPKRSEQRRREGFGTQTTAILGRACVGCGTSTRWYPPGVGPTEIWDGCAKANLRCPEDYIGATREVTEKE
jgi:hypothetical protein